MEQTLKQRLIGAIVLVSLADIFIPIILEGPDDEWTPRSHSVPEQPKMDYRADMELELPPEVPESSVPAVKEVTSDGPVTADTQPGPEKAGKVVATKPPARPAEPVKAAPKPVVNPPIESAPDVPVALQGWFVQVGSFGQEMNAVGLRDRLEAAGFKVKVQAVELGKKHAYRVLVGPNASRTDAEKLAEKLKSGQQLKGMVIEYPG